MNFDDDHEYENTEPQVYINSVFGKGLRVFIYRTARKTDVNYQPGVIFDSTDFAAGKGLVIALETQMSPARI
ncbi:MAG: hypothetical protein AB9834_05950 [Lentimicrobium sp.]